MEGVSFNEEPQYQQRSFTAGVSKITGYVIKWGLAQDQRSAERVLIIVTVAAFVATGLVLYMGMRNPEVDLSNTVIGDPKQYVR